MRTYTRKCIAVHGRPPPVYFLVIYPLHHIFMSALVKPLTWLFGVVLLLVGVLGFFMSPILGIFSVNMLHNIVHVASGVAALVAASMSFSASRMYLIVFGIVYAIVTLAGFINLEPVVSLLMINSADNFLHLAIAAVCLIVGFGSKS